MGRKHCIKDGHQEKYKDGRCAQCARDRVSRFKDKNPLAMAIYSAKYRANNALKCNQAVKKHNSEHPEKRKKWMSRYRSENKGKVNACTAKRYAAKVNATPEWANQFFIEEIYDLAKRRTEIFGFEWQVDHKVPLRSKIVCGLHVEHNLQVIPAIHNQRKNNIYWADMP